MKFKKTLEKVLANLVVTATGVALIGTGLFALSLIAPYIQPAPPEYKITEKRIDQVIKEKKDYLVLYVQEDGVVVKERHPYNKCFPVYRELPLEISSQFKRLGNRLGAFGVNDNDLRVRVINDLNENEHSFEKILWDRESIEYVEIHMPKNEKIDTGEK
ncbi:MAG TPA: hypothetical protein VMZ91_11495 [Candidatus Paceibacterota bacterium]|nr:hypothetical protein [Candidatus Paceibacterota bacterium]